MSYSCSDFYDDVMEAAQRAAEKCSIPFPAPSVTDSAEVDEDDSGLAGDTDAVRFVLQRFAEQTSELRAALAWALEQIDDDLDPDHQAALANARALIGCQAPATPWVQGPYGHGYWMEDGDLWAAPMFTDGTVDREARILVDDFDPPLTRAERADVAARLTVLADPSYSYEDAYQLHARG